jgi:hypothetical protein
VAAHEEKPKRGLYPRIMLEVSMIAALVLVNLALLTMGADRLTRAETASNVAGAIMLLAALSVDLWYGVRVYQKFVKEGGK